VNRRAADRVRDGCKKPRGGFRSATFRSPTVDPCSRRPPSCICHLGRLTSDPTQVVARIGCGSISHGAQRETLIFRATRPPVCICRPAGRGFRKAVNASRTQCTVRFATFANRQTETHFAVTAKNVKQHFNAFFFTRDFHLKLRRACELRTASTGQLRTGQTLLSAPIGVTPHTHCPNYTLRR
jgi:hypothetical protein